MEFSLTEEQQDFRKAAQGIAERFDEPYWQEIDGAERFPQEFWDVLARKGVLGMAIPEAYGGLGRSWLDLVIVAEALAVQEVVRDDPVEDLVETLVEVSAHGASSGLPTRMQRKA